AGRHALRHEVAGGQIGCGLERGTERDPAGAVGELDRGAERQPARVPCDAIVLLADGLLELEEPELTSLDGGVPLHLRGRGGQEGERQDRRRDDGAEEGELPIRHSGSVPGAGSWGDRDRRTTEKNTSGGAGGGPVNGRSDAPVSPTATNVPGHCGVDLGVGRSGVSRK